MKIDLTGCKFGRYTVTREAAPSIGRRGDPLRRWECLCECGNSSVVQQGSLRNGRSKSCGCLHREKTAERFTKHGCSAGGKWTPEYAAWCHMISRCTDPARENYRDYGGRGITVCDEWMKFETFLQDMGVKPSEKHSIDRIDNNGNYEPSNCRWATSHQQSRNHRRNIYLEYEGARMVLKDWAAHTGINYGTLRVRVKNGWSVQDTLTVPADKRNRKHI